MAHVALGEGRERALAPGVLQGYVTDNAALAIVRGRIQVGEQIARRPGIWLPLECSYDEYTADIAENRILRAAIRRVLAVARVPAKIHAGCANRTAGWTGCRH